MLTEIIVVVGVIAICDALIEDDTVYLNKPTTKPEWQKLIYEARIKNPDPRKCLYELQQEWNVKYGSSYAFTQTMWHATK